MASPPSPLDVYAKLLDDAVDAAAKGAYSPGGALHIVYASMYKSVYTMLNGSFPPEEEKLIQSYYRKAENVSKVKAIGVKEDADLGGSVSYKISDTTNCPIPGLAFSSKKTGCGVSSASINASDDSTAKIFALLVAVNEYSDVSLGYDALKSFGMRIMGLMQQSEEDG